MLVTTSRKDLILDLLSDASIAEAIPIVLAGLRTQREAGNLDAEQVARLAWRLSSVQGRRSFADVLRRTADGVLTDYEVAFLHRNRPKIPAAYQARLQMIGEMALMDWMAASDSPSQEKSEG